MSFSLIIKIGLKSLSAKAKVSQTKTFRESPRHSCRLFAVRVSPRQSANNLAADFCGIWE